jgi:hypothetical protein
MCLTHVHCSAAPLAVCVCGRARPPAHICSHQNSLLLALLRPMVVFFQGTWFWHVGAIMFRGECLSHRVLVLDGYCRI